MDKARIAALRLAAIITAFFIIVMLSMTSLNLSLPTESYSPFQGLTAVQTISMAIFAMISFVVLMLVEGRGMRFNSKSIMFVAAAVILSFLMQYAADPRQLQQYSLAFAALYFLPGSIPINESLYFTTIYLLPLLVYGGLLGFLVSYLISDTHFGLKKPNSSVFPETVLRGFLVLFVGPILLTIPIAFAISALQVINPQFFPFYGEGTSGSIIVVSVIFSMYICARIIANWDKFNMKSIVHARLSGILSILVELIAAYACITAAFSLMGGLLTDGTPPPLILPLDYILLAVLATIPFGMLIARDRLFPIPHTSEESMVQESKQ
ncbi:MAG: hypothetical protein ACFFER_04640 [Candidatus Thorarchaeota archaeon]